MIEIIDNAIQLAVLAGCCLYSAILSIRNKKQVWLLLTCFYGAFALGHIHWLLFIMFRSGTPELSPVSDLSWLAGVLFLLVLQNTLSTTEESMYRPLLAWTAPVFSAIMCLFFFRWGDYFLNILWALLMGLCGYYALRGLLFTKRHSNEMHSSKPFHLAVMAFILVEYCLWVSSCFWNEISLSNPYYWFDLLLTATFFTFLPTLKKAVGE